MSGVYSRMTLVLMACDGNIGVDDDDDSTLAKIRHIRMYLEYT